MTAKTDCFSKKAATAVDAMRKNYRKTRDLFQKDEEESIRFEVSDYNEPVMSIPYLEYKMSNILEGMHQDKKEEKNDLTSKGVASRKTTEAKNERNKLIIKKRRKSWKKMVYVPTQETEIVSAKDDNNTLPEAKQIYATMKMQRIVEETRRLDLQNKTNDDEEEKEEELSSDDESVYLEEEYTRLRLRRQKFVQEMEQKGEQVHDFRYDMESKPNMLRIDSNVKPYDLAGKTFMLS
mmetsp:Transcript_29959/g.45416  ORF Transcript_29959/g.45416 Transcript_29959/m.45416 type:complete len:236 (+) Transcript_29959:88-795(+)